MAKAKRPLKRKKERTCSGQAKLGEERSDGVDANEHVMTFHYLLLRHCWELKYYVLPCQPPVNRRERVQLILQRRRILRVQESVSCQSKLPFVVPHLHFQQFRSINGNTGPLSDNLRGENKILQDLLVHRCQCSAARSLLLDPRLASWSSQHSALPNKYDVAIGELLFQFPC